MLQMQLVEIRKLEALLAEQVVRDHLTDLYNRRYLAEFLEHELPRAKRESYPISFVMADIDHFKVVNDTYGHAVGDLMLQNLATQLVEETRASDIVCRYGGEEFLLVLPNTSTQDAVQCAERCRLAFQSSEIAIDGKEISATLSLGVATFPKHGKTSKDILDAVDQAMYLAKSGGRNRVATWKNGNNRLNSAQTADFLSRSLGSRWFHDHSGTNSAIF